jgi:RNA polymerase sigma-70 factor, ECF subfamily
MMMAEGNRTVGAPAILPDVSPEAHVSTQTVPPFHIIYKEFFDFVWSSARHLGASADAIDDVAQDVFIVIHSRLATLQNPEALRSWIYGIVRRTVSDYRRSRRSRDAAGARLGTEFRSARPSLPSPLEMAERSSEVAMLESILAELDEPKREIFVMVEVLEMTVPEVVQSLEIPLNTAYSRLRLARQLFEEALARHEAAHKENR